MADELVHILTANRNQETLRSLYADMRQHAPWVATVAFYKALHIVEAVFANDPAILHCCDHGARLSTLKGNRKYQKIYEHFSKLYRISLVARYLQGEPNGAVQSIFETYLPFEKIVKLVLLHHLHQIEQSALNSLKHGKQLVLMNAFRQEALDAADRATKDAAAAAETIPAPAAVPARRATSLNGSDQPAPQPGSRVADSRDDN